MKTLGKALTALGFFTFFVMLVLTVLENCATNGGLYRELQEENGLPETADVTRDEMETLDNQLAAYLSGDAAALDASALNDTERAHMADVFDLFVLARTVRNLLLPASLVLLGAGLWLSRAQSVMSMCLLGLAALVLPLAALAVWASVDFSAAFTAFHRLLFTNELWLLNPETDVLLRILPEQFFADFAGVVAVRAAAYCAAPPLAIFGVRFGRNFR